jgi:RNase P/RNase MRP subunit POP5
MAVNREELQHVEAACVLYKNPIQVLKVSGTLKGLGLA